MKTMFGLQFYTFKGHSFIPLSIIRIAFGMFYFTAGFNKVFVPANQAAMLETITHAGIPYPAFMAIFVANFEMLAGLLLVMGLFSRFSSLGLLIISLVALFTVGIYEIPQGLNAIGWYSWLIYLPESSYILMSLIILAQGSGPFGLDSIIMNKLSRAY